MLCDLARVRVAFCKRSCVNMLYHVRVVLRVYVCVYVCRYARRSYDAVTKARQSGRGRHNLRNRWWGK